MSPNCPIKHSSHLVRGSHLVRDSQRIIWWQYFTKGCTSLTRKTSPQHATSKLETPHQHSWITPSWAGCGGERSHSFSVWSFPPKAPALHYQILVVRKEKNRLPLTQYESPLHKGLLQNSSLVMASKLERNKGNQWVMQHYKNITTSIMG